MSLGPGHPAVEHLLAAAGQKGAAFFRSQAEVPGQGFSDFPVGVLLAVGDVFEKGEHDGLEVRDGHESTSFVRLKRAERPARQQQGS